MAAWVEIKRTSCLVSRWVLNTSHTPVLIEQIQQLAGDPALFINENAVVDATQLTEPVDWMAIAQSLTAAGFTVLGFAVPVALECDVHQAGFNVVRNALATGTSQSPTFGSGEKGQRAPNVVVTPVATLQGAQSASTSATPSAAEPASAAAGAAQSTQPAPAAEPTAQAQPTLVINKHLRSGQRVYAQKADLIVVGNVSEGAEVIADGNVHVYGHLRGRAIAGASGDVTARIFCQSMEAEMAVIAGIYQMIDHQFDPALLRIPLIVALEGNTLTFNPMDV